MASRQKHRRDAYSFHPEWKLTKLEDHLHPATQDLGIKHFSWTASVGLMRWILYEYKTNTFHLFATRKERRELVRKLRGKKKRVTGIRCAQFKQPLVYFPHPKTNQPRFYEHI